jgi:clan AA aspartic protease
MRTGSISSNREAVLRLEIHGSSGQVEEIEAAIDTGFNDFLTLRPQQIAALGLAQRAYIRASLADGSIVSLPVYTATVLWHNQSRSIDVLETQNDPLIGMSLLYGSRVTLDVIDGGSVVILPLP